MPDQFHPTHKGLLFGFIPVLVDMKAEEIMVRSKWLDPVADLAAGIFGICVCIRQIVQPDYEPQFPVKVMGELK